jgi:PBSX family phage terminase large subunit
MATRLRSLLAVFKPHSEMQDRCIFSEKPIVIMACGIQSGKTLSGAMRTKMAMHKYRDPKDNFIIAAPTYKVMQQATLPEFLHLMRGYGEYSKGDAVFKMNNGGTCYMRTASDCDSVIGITNVRHIHGDEAGLYPLYFHENLQARASFRQAPICYTTSPYSLNWLYTDYIKKIMAIRKKIAAGVALTPDEKSVFDEVELVQMRSKDNPYFPDEEYERKRASMDPRRFNMIYGGNFERMEGLVYDCFREEMHIVPAETLPDGTVFLGCVDWGYTNPACILILAVTPNGWVYLVNEFYKTQQTIGQMVDAAERFKKIYGVTRFYCDPSSPANIVEFNKVKLTAIPAANDIRPGIDATYELINSNKFRVFEGRAPNFIDEISVYHYPNDDDVDADKDVKEKLPVKQFEHSMDAFRYACYAMKLVGVKKRVAVEAGVSRVDTRSHKMDELLKRKVVSEYDW